MRYDGPVTIILGDGTELQAMGSFRTTYVGNLLEWSGEITADDFATLTQAHGTRELVTVRLPGGGEGKALVSNLSASMGSGPATARVEITGSGPAPY